MTADRLRAAASAMRERAEAATPGPWRWWNLDGIDQGWSDNGPSLERAEGEWRVCEHYCQWREGDDLHHRGERGVPYKHEHHYTDAVLGAWGHDAWGVSIERPDAEHIASWHPAVALAVADWLEAAAEHDDIACPAADQAIRVANAYLGES